MEEKLSKYAVNAIGGSYISIIVLVLFIYGVLGVISGDIVLLENTFMLKVFVIAALYILSIALLATLANKSTTRRFVSWAYSVIFHAGLLVYLGVFQEIGSVIIIIGIAESLVLILSISGLGAWCHNVYFKSQV